jgi:microcin C transport system substrate-binding protein
MAFYAAHTIAATLDLGANFMRYSLMVLAVLFTALQAHAAISPMKVTALGKPDAPIGGTFNRNLEAEPENLNPTNSSEVVSASVQEYVVEGLLTMNPETYEWQPQLAESYEVSKDGLSFTFHLRKDAKFSDGSPVTAEDVKFSIELVKDPAYKATARMPYYDDLEKIETPDAQTVIVKMKRKYFMNMMVLASWGYTPIVSKKIYGDPTKKFSDYPLYGSGPYKVEVYNRGKNIMLVRNPDWWGKNYVDQKGLAKFERINFHFIKEQNLEIEMVRKGQIDYMDDVRPENFEKKAVGDAFGTTVKKIQAENLRNKPWSFIGWNEKNQLFQDKNVRIALAELLNRKFLIDKFYYGMAVEARSPWYYKSPFASPNIKPIEFNPEHAKQLLKKAGWEDKEKKGVLQKQIDGKTVEFRFALLLPTRDVEKYFTLYKEDLNKAGIDMEIKLIEWNTFEKLLNEQKFDAVTLRWGNGSFEDDPKQIWHSESSKPGGSNFISYSNKEVDKLIDSARQEMNKEKRKLMWQKISKLIADDAPYAFMFNMKYDLYLLNKRVGFDKPTYKYDLSYPYFYMAPQ